MAGNLWNDELTKPLQHIRVVDLTTMIAGPYLTRMMAQYGAEIVKVENMPSGDPLRAFTDSGVFSLLNQGKKALALNFGTAEGKGLIRQLATEADIFIEDLPEGVMDRMGLGYSDISELCPDLIYLSLRGHSGNQAVKSGHDLNFIAQSGCGEWFLESGAPNYSTQFAEIIAGALVPLAKLTMHLCNPDRTGMHLVSYIDESFRTIFLPRAYDRTGPISEVGKVRAESPNEQSKSDQGFQRRVSGNFPHTHYYRCRDGLSVSLNALEKDKWDAFCDAVDREGWKIRHEDPSLIADLEKLFMDAPSTYWEALTQDRDICLFKVVPWTDHLALTSVRTVLATDPLTWCGFVPNAKLRPAGGLGSDTFAVATQMGLDAKAIADLLSRGILYAAKPQGES